MSEKCPNCGSYNTGTAYLNYAAKGIRVAAKFGAALALGLIAGSAHGAHAGKELLEDEEHNCVLGHKCHNCGNEW